MPRRFAFEREPPRQERSHLHVGLTPLGRAERGNPRFGPGIWLAHDQRHPSRPGPLQLPGMRFLFWVYDRFQKCETDWNDWSPLQCRFLRKAPPPLRETGRATTLRLPLRIESSPAPDHSVFQGVAHLIRVARLEWPW